VILVPEGLVAAIPEMHTLIGEMTKLLRGGAAADAIPSLLTPWSAAVLSFLPPVVRAQLYLERESSGAVQLSQISSETLLAELVASELAGRAKAGTYKGKFATVNTSFGYQARSAMPSNFDVAYGEALGRTAAVLAAAGRSGYMATVANLAAPAAAWTPSGVPLTAMMRVPPPGSIHAHAYGGGEGGGGEAPPPPPQPAAGGGEASATPGAMGPRPVLPCAPVDVHGAAFAAFAAAAPGWRGAECYANRGPIQFAGVSADDTTATLALARGGHMARIAKLRGALDAVRGLCQPGVGERSLDAAESAVDALLRLLTSLRDAEN